jgi:hypothetical protein
MFKALVVNDATPDPFSVVILRVIAPSLNCTVPAGVVVLLVTVTVNITD